MILVKLNTHPIAMVFQKVYLNLSYNHFLNVMLIKSFDSKQEKFTKMILTLLKFKLFKKKF